MHYPGARVTSLLVLREGGVNGVIVHCSIVISMNCLVNLFHTYHGNDRSEPGMNDETDVKTKP